MCAGQGVLGFTDSITYILIFLYFYYGGGVGLTEAAPRLPRRTPMSRSKRQRPALGPQPIIVLMHTSFEAERQNLRATRPAAACAYIFYNMAEADAGAEA